MPIPTISPGEMQLLLSRAGLVLNPGQVADLVLAWRQVAALIASIPHGRPLADDMALTFRLTPPTTAAAVAPQVVKVKVKAQAKAPKEAQGKVRAKVQAKAKSAAKRRAVRPQASKGARRSR
jgi:hypothetical protein